MSRRPTLLLILLVGVPALAAPRERSADVAARRAAAEQFAAVWSVRADETDGASSAEDPTRQQFIESFPHVMTVVGDKYRQEHSNLAVSVVEEGTFAVVRVLDGHAEVDVTATHQVGGDGHRRPDREFVRKEVWRLVDADTLQRCLPTGTQDRPPGFTTKKGDGLVLMTFKRLK